MDIAKYRLSKLYIYATVTSLFILLGYYYYKYLKDYDEKFAHEFNFLALIIFLSSVVLLILLFCEFKVKNKIVFYLIFFILTSSTIFSYDFINPTVCGDCASNILVGKRFRQQGIVSFLKNYHKPSLYKIKKSPQIYERFLQYNNQFRFNYKRLFNNIENEPPDVVLSDNTDESVRINYRIGKHSPLWFCVLGLWETFAGDSYFSQVIIPANLVTILYLSSLHVFLGLFFKREEYRNKLMIIVMVLLLPAFLQQVAQTNSDLILGTIVTWVIFFLLKSDNEKISSNDFLVGFCYSIAVLIKFTSLTLLLPIALFYLIRFKFKAIPKLLVFLLSFSLFPILLCTLFEYDMILNILTGKAEESVIQANIATSALHFFAWFILYNQYHFGIPFVLLLITHIAKLNQYLTRKEFLISYMFIAFFFMLCFLLWEDLPRLWLGFIPLTIPFLVNVYKKCEEKIKMFLLTGIFLLINNLLILIFMGIILAGYISSHDHMRYWRY